MLRILKKAPGSKNDDDGYAEIEKLVKTILYILCFCTCFFFFIKVMFL